MKEEGLVDAVGLAAGRVDVMMPMLGDWDFDAIITHNRFTLVNRNAEAMIDFCVAKGIAVLNAAPYASGVLAKGAHTGTRYAYQDADRGELSPDPPDRGDLRPPWRADRRRRAAVLPARQPRHLDHRRRQPAGAHRPDARMGELADPRRPVGGAAAPCPMPPTIPRRRASTSLGLRPTCGAQSDVCASRRARGAAQLLDLGADAGHIAHAGKNLAHGVGAFDQEGDRAGAALAFARSTPRIAFRSSERTLRGLPPAMTSTRWSESA